ncbi:P-loop containing nucleoside triphosphate hydrolase protein [Auriculariales sp. MPI-PUGE-AT-0066]|nr:P-loop containing nucleoside triphosphate hydrolase protein [Auriculariales sp. MPI-PUGE-AT-0066]
MLALRLALRVPHRALPQFRPRRARWASGVPVATAASDDFRQYQEDCVQSCLNALVAGHTRIGVSLPTGSGKTKVFLQVLGRMETLEGRSKALIIVNSVELAKQAALRAKEMFPNWSIDIEQGQKHVASGNADLTVATYQTMARTPERLHKFDPNQMKAIIVDEAHHAAAASYRTILSYFDKQLTTEVDSRPPSLVPILGFSATFNRHDGLALNAVFDRIVYHRDLLEMIKEEWLCAVRFTSVKAQLDLSDVTINGSTGDFNATSLAHVINTDTINKLVFQAWVDLTYAATHKPTRKSTLIFCVNIAHVQDLTEIFCLGGIDARCLHSGTPVAERVDLLNSFREQKFPVLINCAILTEGADFPKIDCVVIARPTRSRNLFTQMIGRGMRRPKETEKKDCHIIDFVDSTTRVQGIITIPTLFGLTIEDGDIKDVSLEELEERGEEAARRTSPANVPQPTSVSYRDYEDPFALVQDTSGCPHISVMSSFSWVGVGDDTYVLECLGKGFIKIRPFSSVEDAAEWVAADTDNGNILNGNPAYTAHFVPVNNWAQSNSPYLKPRRILTAATLADAVRGVDQYAKNKVCPGRMSQGLHRAASWRRAPASAGQVKVVATRWGLRSADAVIAPTPEMRDREKRLKALTKGQAGDIITRIKHGAVVSTTILSQKAAN